MPCGFRFSLLVTLGLLVVAVHPVSGKELEDRDWIEVRSPNFRIRSTMREKDSIELARQLETFRVAISIVSNFSLADSPIPTEILALRRSVDFRSLGISSNIAGIFLAGLRRNFVVIRNVRDAPETPIIIHEYVHFLLGNHGSFSYPRWYNEGIAEYLSAEQTRPGKFVVGGLQDGRLRNLSRFPWIPLRQILAPEDYDEWSRQRTAMFYSEAWLLVHYLHHRPERNTLGHDMARYIELVDSGKSNLEAFEEAFRITARELDVQVKKYAQGRDLPAYQFDVDKILPDFEPKVIRLRREQISLTLGQAALSLGELDSAKHWFTIAATDELFRPRAEAGLGDVLKFGGDFEAALPFFENAVALAPNDPYCQLDMAEYWHSRARETHDAGDRATYLANARKHYLKAWKLDDSMPETYAQYGETFLMEDERHDKAIEMLELAESILPSSITVRARLADAYMGAGREEDALRAARSVLAWSHEESNAAEQARKILAELTSATE